MRDKAQELLMRGFTTPMIARHLHVSPSTAARLVSTPTDEYEPADRHAHVWRGARARAATLLMGLGFTQGQAAAYMGVDRRSVYNYLRECEPAGQPLIRIGLLKEIRGNQGEVIGCGEYRLLDFAPDVGMVRLDKSDGRIVHFADPAALHGNCELLSKSLYEVPPCRN